MGRYRNPAGGLEWDGAQEGDLLVGFLSLDGRVVFLPLHRPSDWEAVEAAGGLYQLVLASGIPAWGLTDAVAVDSPMFVGSEPAGSIGELRLSDSSLLYGVPE